MSETVILQVPGSPIIDEIKKPLFPHIDTFIEELPNTILSISKANELGKLNSLLSPHVEKCQLYSLNKYAEEFDLTTDEIESLRIRHENNNHQPTAPILVIEAYVIIPEGERYQDISINWQDAPGLEMEAYFFHYQQNGGQSLQQKNTISRIRIARFVEPDDSFALIKFFLWNKNPTTSRGTVTTVQSPDDE